MDSQIFTHVNITDKNKIVIENFAIKAKNTSNFQCYIIGSPLGEKYKYDYEESAIVILIPKHKIIFLNLGDNTTEFNYYVDDFIEDLSAISDKFKYKGHIGRPRDWREKNTMIIDHKNLSTVDNLIEKARLKDPQEQRISDLLISLLIGSINDIDKIGAEVPISLLEKIKRNIVLFDNEQTRFIYQEFSNKTVVIQGLSGTGKTELLLHKLKDLHVNSDSSKIFLTCHNIALANTLKQRIPNFFNFMRVERQIEWNKNLWVDRAWGSRGDRNSGIYSYLSYFYNIPFLRYSKGVTYETIFSLALEHIENIPENNFEHAFDYILIDERQDFPDVFFKLCEKVSKNKVFVAGDIFQDIFETSNEKILDVDVILNKCYRTDPRTLMFAHSIGLGLFEDKKWNWFEDTEWNAFGYNIKRLANREIHFSRNPIRRFEDVDIDNFQSVEIIKSTSTEKVLDVIQTIISKDDQVKPDDIAIIIMEDGNQVYKYIDTLAVKIQERFNWTSNRAHESKVKIENTIYITNSNNVKGLEFPFVLCLSGSIKNTYRYRNILYTMLTRSFLQSYLMITDADNIANLEQGLETINKYKFIKAQEPTDIEKQEIKNNLIKFLKKPSKSFKEFLDDIFNELHIDEDKRPKLEEALSNTTIEKFDDEMTRNFILQTKNFY